MNLGVALDWYRLSMEPIPAELLKRMGRLKRQIDGAEQARAELAKLVSDAIVRGEMKPVQFGRWLAPEAKRPSQNAWNFVDRYLPDPD